MTIILIELSIEEEFAQLDASEWAVSPIEKRGGCPLEPQGVPTPPFWNVTRVWHDTTGTWVGLRLFRDGVSRAESRFVEPEKDRRTTRGKLTVTGISVMV